MRGVSSRRDAVITAVLGVVLFLLCALLARRPARLGVVRRHLRVPDLPAAHGAGLWPYHDFFDEYAPLAQPLFYVVGWLPGSYAHAFRWTMVAFGAGTLVLLVASLVSLGASRRRLAIAAATVGVSPLLLGQSAFNEFDFWPALLTSAALLAMIRRRWRTAYVLLALGVRRRRIRSSCCRSCSSRRGRAAGGELVKRGLVWFAGALVVVHLPFATVGPGGLRFS